MKDPSESIQSFSGPYSFLSNFYPAKVRFEGEDYPSVENAYQAAKTGDPKAREFFKTCTPGQAKRNAPHRPEGWFDRSLVIMEYLVMQKFSVNTELGDKLLETGDLELVEGNTWGDTFFGVCNGKGENHLGKILMSVRNTLRVQKEMRPMIGLVRKLVPELLALEIIGPQPLLKTPPKDSE